MKHTRLTLIFIAPLSVVLFMIFTINQVGGPAFDPASAVELESSLPIVGLDSEVDRRIIVLPPLATPQIPLPSPTSIDSEQVELAAEPTQPAQVVEQPPAGGLASPTLAKFVGDVSDGEAEIVKGIYVEGLLALAVVQQPNGDVAFVSGEEGVATEFQNARINGVTGILAHNYLSGRLFYELVPGDQVVVVYGDGSTRQYVVEGLHQFERVERRNVRSPFIDLTSGESLTSTELFTRFYRDGDHLALQTCLERNGVLDFGVLFIVARPVEATGTPPEMEEIPTGTLPYGWIGV